MSDKEFRKGLTDYYNNGSLGREKAEAATDDELRAYLREKIKEAFSTKQWKRFRNFNIWVSEKIFGCTTIVRPVAFGGIPGNFNPRAFTHFSLMRNSDFCTNQAIEYLIKHLNYTQKRLNA